MMTVKELSDLSGVSVRTLHYYDQIDLLKPESITKAGYRLYGDKSLKRLSTIMFFKELDFPLAEIKSIIDNKQLDEKEVLEKQIELLTEKRNRLNNIISLAKKIKKGENRVMSFWQFDTTKLEEYKNQAREKWGSTDAYKEYEEKSKGRTQGEDKMLATGLMQIFADFGEIKDKPLSDESVMEKVDELKAFITENYYTCTNEILLSLGEMYISGGEMTENIDSFGGKGTAEFVNKAIKEYVK